MPIVMRKIKNKNLYTVKNAKTGKVHSYGSTYANAKKQRDMLESIEAERRLKG